MKEAVGEFAEPIYDLIDMHFEGDCQRVFDDLVQTLFKWRLNQRLCSRF